MVRVKEESRAVRRGTHFLSQQEWRWQCCQQPLVPEALTEQTVLSLTGVVQEPGQALLATAPHELAESSEEHEHWTQTALWLELHQHLGFLF